MANYPVECPYCGLIVDSQDSMADSYADLDLHIEAKHLEKVEVTAD